MRRILRNNGLSLALFCLFALTLVGQSLTGLHVYNDEQRSHGASAVSYIGYLKTGEFLEVTMENWESEFFQMFVYVVFTIFLFQKGSSESKSPDEPEEVDRDPRAVPVRSDSPFPVRRGGWMLRLYEHSLSSVFLLLFLTTFYLHGRGGVRAFNEERLAHGEHTISLGAYFLTSKFWFESLQNWQSEFLAIGSMVILSVYLRQRGSPESKPVDAAHDENE